MRKEAIERYAEHVKSLNENGKKYSAEECTLLIIGFAAGWDAHRALVISIIRELK